MMVGRDVSQVYVRNQTDFTEEALKVEHLSDFDGRVNDISFHVRKGEIVGLAGLVGAGRTETAELIYGIRPIKEGEITVFGKKVDIKNATNAVKLGIGLISEDRKTQGLALSESIAQNTVAVSLNKIFPNFFINQHKIREIAMEFTNKLRIMTTSVEKKTRFLSGGNQQKVVLAKWLSYDPEILIFDEPTRGIDVGAKMEIYNLMDRMASEGKAIIMISSELPEVIGMSDRIYIMQEGSIVGEVHRGDQNCNQEAIGELMMLGIGGNGE